MASGDVYMIKDHQLFGPNQVLNVYFYRALNAGLTATDLRAGFQSTLMPYITGAQVTAMNHIRSETINLFDATDFDDINVSAAGNIAATTAELMPSFVAASIRMNRQRADMRHGYKRICGLHEDVVQGNGWATGHAQYTALNTLATHLSDVLDNPVGAPSDWEPVVVKRIKYTAPSGKVAWRLPNSQAELVYYVITSAALQLPSTQVTRKD